MKERVNEGPEYHECQLPALDLLRNYLRYQVADGRSSSFAKERDTEAETLMVGRLVRSLMAINQGLSETGAKQAVAALRQPVAAGLLDTNEACHRLLSRWVTVEEIDPATRKTVMRSVRFIDFDQPENNDFLVVEELTVKGPHGNRRLDLAVFVNGIPVVAIECKQPGDSRGIEKAVNDLFLYQQPDDGIARFFHTVQLCIALKRNDARYGTVATPLKRFAEWKTLYPNSRIGVERELGRATTTQDRLLIGMLSKANLLDLIRGFIVFDREGGQMVKKVARYQQFEAVNEAIRRAWDDGGKLPLRDRGGIIWHTQGSGKSLTMLWLCLKLRREKALGNPTLLIVTDRRDLDRQITETFRNCGFENPVRVEKVTHLKSLLQGPSGQTLMTTIQKFQDDVASLTKGRRVQPLVEQGNIFVLIDEAHRTEYGLFNARLRKVLPSACQIAFTGTPISKTEEKFGSYIHRYTMPQSVEDGSTVPILYESRLPELAVWGKRIDPLFEAELSHLTKDQREEIKKKEVTARRIAEAPDRVEMIALDMFQHYRANFESDGFKAQVAACSQRAAAMYWEQLDKLMPGRVALLISDPSEKDSKLWGLRRKFASEEQIIDDFKNGSVAKLAIIVVMNKYLTGFDAPIERVLYLDKPLQEHGLLQAIARVNRPLPEKDKQWGLVVDYWGVAGFLDKALENLSDEVQPEMIMHRRDDEDAFNALRQRHADVFSCFPPNLDRKNIEPWIMALELEDRRSVFQARYRSFYQSLEQLLPDPRALDYMTDFAWMRRVRREAHAFFHQENVQLPDCSEKVRKLIDRHVRGEEVKVLLEPISILSKDFSKELDKLHDMRAKAIRMRHAIKHTITVKLHEDPVFYESLKERLERIIKEREANVYDEVAEFKLLAGLADDLKRKGTVGDDLGLPQDVMPFFRVLTQASKPADSEDGKIHEDSGIGPAVMGKLAGEIFATVKELAVIDWIHKEDVQRAMRREIKRYLRMNYSIPPARIEELTTSLMDLARVHLSR